MEHPTALLEALPTTEAIILTYKPTKPIFGLDTLMYYVVKSEYKGLPVILCFTPSDVDRYTLTSSGVCPECEKCLSGVGDIEGGVDCGIVLGDTCIHLHMPKKVFDARICNKSIILLKLLEHLYVTPDSNMVHHEPCVFTDFKTHSNVTSLTRYDGKAISHCHYHELEMRKVAPCNPFYTSDHSYADSLRTKAMVNLNRKSPSIFNLLNTI